MSAALTSFFCYRSKQSRYCYFTKSRLVSHPNITSAKVNQNGEKMLKVLYHFLFQFISITAPLSILQLKCVDGVMPSSGQCLSMEEMCVTVPSLSHCFLAFWNQSSSSCLRISQSSDCSFASRRRVAIVERCQGPFECLIVGPQLFFSCDRCF